MSCFKPLWFNEKLYVLDGKKNKHLLASLPETLYLYSILKNTHFT